MAYALAVQNIALNGGFSFAGDSWGLWMVVCLLRDLPDFDHLSQFAPSAQSVVSDSCLAGPSTVVAFDGIGKPLRDALATAEPTRPLPAASLADRIADTLLCNRREGEGKRHLNEFRLSWHIRMHFSEQQLFTIYANRAYFGAGAIGVENASRQFFHKDADALSIEEAALIAGLLRAPDYFSPYKHPERALQRRNKILEAMVAHGKLSASDAARAEATPVVTQ
jgi:membrane carboxypeptidase/penicillin-binding protein